VVSVGVVGATGYTGEEIVRLLAGHKKVKITVLQAVIEKEEPISKMLPSLDGKLDLVCEKPDSKKAIEGADLFFLALPHKVSMKVAPEFLRAGKKVIDLSADYRLPEAVYEKWYGVKHTDKGNIEGAVYGLPELFRKEIKKAELIANPGCYPTSVILAVLPVVKGIAPCGMITVASMSGFSGAGRNSPVGLNFSGNAKAYKVGCHQHMPEMAEILSEAAGKKVNLLFSPHLIPTPRGISSTVYIPLKPDFGLDEKAVLEKYKSFYKNEPFVRICGEGKLPEIKSVVNTNYCDIGIKLTGEFLIVVSCIDNLLKGAAGQAVENMNIMYGFDETEGLL